MKEMVVDKRVCLFSFQAHEFQTNVLPYPNNIINAINSYMPMMAIQRNEKLQETMRVNFFTMNLLKSNYLLKYLIFKGRIKNA